MRTATIQAELAKENWPPSIIAQVIVILNGAEPATLADVWNVVRVYEEARRPTLAKVQADIAKLVADLARRKESAEKTSKLRG